MKNRRLTVTTASYLAIEDASRDLANAMSALAEDSNPVRGQSVRIVLGRPPCHRRELTALPPMSRSALRRHVAANEDQYFPRSSGGLTTDAHWSGTRAGGTAIAYAVETAWLRSLLHAMETSGFRVEGVEPDGAVTGRLDLTPPDERRAQRTHELRRLAYSSCGALVLTVLSLLLATAGVRHGRRSLERIAPTPTEMREIAALEREAASFALTDSILAHERRTNARLAVSLQSIVEALPDSARLERIELTAGRPTRVSVIAEDPGAFLEGLRTAGFIPQLRVMGTPTLVQRGVAMWLAVELREESAQ